MSYSEAAALLEVFIAPVDACLLLSCGCYILRYSGQCVGIVSAGGKCISYDSNEECAAGVLTEELLHIIKKHGWAALFALSESEIWIRPVPSLVEGIMGARAGGNYARLQEASPTWNYADCYHVSSEGVSDLTFLDRLRKENAYVEQEIGKKTGWSCSRAVILPGAPFRKFNRKTPLLVRVGNYRS